MPTKALGEVPFKTHRKFLMSIPSVDEWGTRWAVVTMFAVLQGCIYIYIIYIYIYIYIISQLPQATLWSVGD